MVAMNAESKGYAGTINTQTFASMSNEFGVSASVESGWAPVPNAGVDRGVKLTAGTGFGYGVIDTTQADVAIAGDPVTVGTERWDTLVVRRNWAPGVPNNERTTLELVKGTAAKAVAAGVLPRAGAGTSADQLIGLCRFVAGSSAVSDIEDLRTWAGDGGMIARSDLIMPFFEGELGARIVVNDRNGGSREWLRTFTPEGLAQWQTSWMRGVPLHTGPGQLGLTALNGGVPLDAPFYIAGGTVASTIDGAAYFGIVFPKPFPNGLLSCVVMNGDDTAYNDMTFSGDASGPWGAGAKDRYVVRVKGPVSGGRGYIVGVRIRVNWIAIGW